MYLKYQTFRNTVVGTTVAVLAAVGFVYTRESSDNHAPVQPPRAAQAAAEATTRPSAPSAPPPTKVDDTPRVRNLANAIGLPEPPAAGPAEPAAIVAEIESSDMPWAAPDAPRPLATPAERSERYRSAMRIVESVVPSEGKGKDVLGPSSPWKLNLYDDDTDGHWDRGKLDINRDDIDDEDWTFKKGRWEKDGGRTIWNGNDWIAGAATSKPDSARGAATDPQLARYRLAMQLASRRAAPDGKGKDVLGPSSPWKLNLYDDDQDGQWDRGKLDYNRDEVDDEKWNFKDGRWEKDGGQTIWNGSDWVPSGK